MDLRTILKFIYHDFRLHVAFTLVLVWLLALWRVQTVNAFLFPLLAIVFMVIFDLSTTWIRDHKIYFPSAALVTGLLIGLIIDPSTPIWTIGVTSLLASLSKQFIKTGLRQHIFNPAAFGIMAKTNIADYISGHLLYLFNNSIWIRKSFKYHRRWDSHAFCFGDVARTNDFTNSRKL
ncbi:MAG: hypothetical protein UU56_C0014G0005 [Candidatus Curtissbacteria bacterium GW2011_GWA2_41_24]|uniref:Uncharacterized protein n=1 Tax=Candidatus Curtissbacteria bacterium GW2011_GWA2_41_24 TaxID=1618411 RepID=A0A0G0Y2X2_9BACT|nr:MAG: hypothetical protein UU56_C0014G0005 [Candidatus Curtissbacteria bacterium GW2011_GWA2_41_24]